MPVPSGRHSNPPHTAAAGLPNALCQCAADTAATASAPQPFLPSSSDVQYQQPQHSVYTAHYVVLACMTVQMTDGRYAADSAASENAFVSSVVVRAKQADCAHPI
jgi:hypothetical protein